MLVIASVVNLPHLQREKKAAILFYKDIFLPYCNVLQLFNIIHCYTILVVVLFYIGNVLLYMMKSYNSSGHGFPGAGRP